MTCVGDSGMKKKGLIQDRFRRQKISIISLLTGIGVKDNQN